MTSSSATPPSGASNQRSMHLREKQKLTKKIFSPRRLTTSSEFAESDDERLHHHHQNDNGCPMEDMATESPRTAFRRRERLRSSLPVVSCRNKSLERPLGTVFLTYRNETKRGLLPNEITSISTVWALFVRAWPDHLTMKGFETPQAYIVCILNRAINAYRPLADLREVVDQSALLVPCIDDNRQTPTPHSAISGKSSSPQPTNHDAGISVTRSSRSVHRKPRSLVERRQTITYDGDGRPRSNTTVEPHNGMLSRFEGSGVAVRPRTAEDGCCRSDALDSNTRHRLSTVESQLASLRAMVVAAMKKQDDDDEMKMERKQLLSPLPHQHLHQQQQQQLRMMPRTDALNDGCCRDVVDIRRRLGDVMQQLKVIKNEVIGLRQMQVDCATSMEKAREDTALKIQAAVISLMKSSLAQRENVSAEQTQYKADILGAETRLRSLEESVQGFRKRDGIDQKTTMEVTVSEVERMVVELTRINKSLTTARGKFRNIQEQMTSLAEMGWKPDDVMKRFLEEEPKRLERLFSRCRQVTGSLAILKKVAVAQSNQNANGSSTTSLAHLARNGERPPTPIKQLTSKENEVPTKISHSLAATKSHTEAKRTDNQSSAEMSEVAVQPSSCVESPNKKLNRIELHLPRRPVSAASLGVSLLPRLESHTSAGAGHPISNRNQQISRQSSPSPSSSSSSNSSSSSVTMASPRQSDCSPKAKRVAPDPPLRRFTRLSVKEASVLSHRTSSASSSMEGSACDLRQRSPVSDAKAPHVTEKRT